MIALQLRERICKTETEIRQIFARSMEIMLTKNRQRGDCWRDSGLLAQFIEIHSMYNRLRNLIWLRETPSPDTEEWKEWEMQVANALEDMRNFTMLAELCLLDKNMKGEKYFNDKL